MLEPLVLIIYTTYTLSDYKWLGEKGFAKKRTITKSFTKMGDSIVECWEVDKRESKLKEISRTLLLNGLLYPFLMNT